MSHFASIQPCSSWGRVARTPLPVATPQFRDQLPSLLAEKTGGSKLAVGLRRSYGDSVINSGGSLVDMTHLDRIIAFDMDKGKITAEAGISISDILKLTVPHGWFTATTPGTRFVTLGGAVANDVHGKNHHQAGTFGCSVEALELQRSDQSLHKLFAKDGSASPIRIEPRHYLRQAMLITLLNPKAIVFYMAFFPLFVDPARHQGLVTFGAMAATIAFLTFLYGLTVVLLTHFLAERMRANPRITQALNKLAGVFLIGFGVKLALSK